MEKNEVKPMAPDYEGMYHNLLNQHRMELAEKDNEYKDLVQSQINEINWLKAIISSILHI